MSSPISIHNSESWFSKLSTMIAGLAAILLCVCVVVITYQRLHNTGSHRTVIIGKIVDKQTRFHESELGSSIDWQLVIVEKDDKQEIVTIDEQLYRRAQIGQWLKKEGLNYKLGGKELLQEINTPTPK